MASTFRNGRALIAGDAAHLTSPLGGQGMNTGLSHAFNLGWKLALVIQGRADEFLVDAYEAERRPAVERIDRDDRALDQRAFRRSTGGRLFRRWFALPAMRLRSQAATLMAVRIKDGAESACKPAAHADRSLGVVLRSPSSEAATPCRTVEVGIAADGPPAATNVASPCQLRSCRQRDPVFGYAVVLTICHAIILTILLLQLHLTAPRRRLEGTEVVRLPVGLEGPVHTVSPRRDDGFVGDLRRGRDGLDHNCGGSHGSRGRGSTLLRVALMLEVADNIRRDGVLRLRLHGKRLDGRGTVIHVFICRSWHDEQGAPH
jgi:hypothetical protein